MARTYTDAELLCLPAGCLTDRKRRHEYYRKQTEQEKRSRAIVPWSTWINAALRVVFADAVEGEVVEIGGL
jgi:hypothetical protein